MYVIIIIGTLLVLCLGVFDRDNKGFSSRRRQTLLLNLLYFGFGFVAVFCLILLQSAHLEHIRDRKDFRRTEQAASDILTKGCFKTAAPEVLAVLVMLNEDIETLLGFV